MNLYKKEWDWKIDRNEIMKQSHKKRKLETDFLDEIQWEVKRLLDRQTVRQKKVGGWKEKNWMNFIEKEKGCWRYCKSIKLNKIKRDWEYWRNWKKDRK